MTEEERQAFIEEVSGAAELSLSLRPHIPTPWPHDPRTATREEVWAVDLGTSSETVISVCDGDGNHLFHAREEE